MSSAIQPNTPPNPTVTAAAGPVPEELVQKKPSPKAEPSYVDLRLVIEEAEDGNGFIYKTLDRRTGEILQVFPRDDVLKLKDATTYQPGTVVDQRT